MGYVYALSVDGADFRYVGATERSVSARLWDHRKAARFGSKAPVCQWMREVGDTIVNPTILAEAEGDELWQQEIAWIASLRAEGYDLFNRSSGGPGRPGAPYTEEQRRQLSELRRGKPHGKRHEFKDPARQVDSGVLGAHNRWHVARGKTSPTCTLCTDSHSSFGP